MIDWNSQSVSINPENSFLLKQWTGEDKDTTLGELAEFLRGLYRKKFWNIRTHKKIGVITLVRALAVRTHEVWK